MAFASWIMAMMARECSIFLWRHCLWRSILAVQSVATVVNEEEARCGMKLVVISFFIFLFINYYMMTEYPSYLEATNSVGLIVSPCYNIGDG
jgi:hypothetical protein